jgi:DNA-binding response OmpR family regulator
MGADSPIVVAKPDILLLDADALAETHLPLLREQYHVTLGQSAAAAADYLARGPAKCDFLISDISGNEQETFRLFRTAKSLMVPPTILVTTADAERVPDALIAGGDAILLKPFTPNLLFTRLGRLKQERNARKQIAAIRSARAPQAHTAPHTVDSFGVHCPHCNATGAVTFDFLSHRRAWYACLACRKTWIAKTTDA